MTVRRDALAVGGAAAAAGLLVPVETGALPAIRELVAMPASSPKVGRFKDPLPWLLDPSLTAVPTTDPADSGADYYEITMKAGAWQFHSDFLGPSPTWGYWAGTRGIGYLGPTIVAHRDRPIAVKFVNELPTTEGAFPVAAAIDPTIMGAGLAPGRAVPHLHGGFTAPQFDGHPDSWWAAAPGGSDSTWPNRRYGPRLDPAVLTAGQANAVVFRYSNRQPAGMLWYHDHARGVTRLNAYVGLAALYVIRDEWDTGGADNPLGLPVGRCEVPLVIQDRQFNADGTLFYPADNGFRRANPSHPHPIWIPEFFGDTPVVNAVAFPYLDVEPRRYRFRAVNGSQARFYNLSFKNTRTGKRLPMWVVGMDQSLLPEPARLDTLLLAPGERADIVFDFAALKGATVMLTNDAQAPYPGGDRSVPGIPELLQIRVGTTTGGPDTSRDPARLTLPQVPGLKVDARPEREVVLTERLDAAGQPIEATLNARSFVDAVEEAPGVGTVEAWNFVNTTGDAHPMHLHLVQFQVVSRQPFNAARYLADYSAWVVGGRPPAGKPALAKYVSGRPSPPAPEETGWKDTAKAYPGEVLKVKARFDVPPLTALPATYVYHCHILEHEENDMMRPFEVRG
jgi:spore coat protein A